MKRSLLFILRNLIFSSCILVFVSFQASAGTLKDAIAAGNSDAVFITDALKNEIKIMSWNVENLFDTTHDAGMDDYTFLPMQDPLKRPGCEKMAPGFYKNECFTTNWTEKKLQIKLGQIQKMVEYQGSTPDIIALQEVENDHVVKMLADLLGYDFITAKGDDRRGIEVALLYKTEKLNLIETASFPMKAPGNPGRNILRAHFDVKGLKNSSTLVVYVNHWPSMANPVKERLDAANILRKNIDDLINTRPDEDLNIVSVGDYNTNDKEKPNAFDILQDAKWSNQLIDGLDLARASKNPAVQYFPEGTYYYKSDRTWNRFDRVILSQSLNDGSLLEFMPTSLRVLYTSLNTHVLQPTQTASKQKPLPKFPVPWSYDHNADSEDDAGFSDHLPVVFKLKIKKK